MNRVLVSLSVAAMLAFAGAAQAATVQVLNTSHNFILNPPTDTLSTGAGGVWSVLPSERYGDSGGVYRSPFDPSGNTVTPANYADWGYWAVGPDNPNNPAWLDFAVEQTSLQFLWGSVDTYNSLQFWLNDALAYTVAIADLVGQGAQLGVGAATVLISDLRFDQIRFFSNGSNAFEFAMIQTTPVPIPPALLLFGSALVGLGYLARRRRQSTGPGLEAA